MYTPLVFNDTYGDYWTTTTTLTSPFVNPYFVSTMNTPIRTHVSSLGTAVNTTIIRCSNFKPSIFTCIKSFFRK